MFRLRQRALPSWLQTILYGLWPQSYLHWCARRYGDRFVLRLPAVGESIVLGRPDAIRETLALRSDQFVANAAMLEPFLGAESLLCLSGDAHDRQRRLLGRAFRGDVVRVQEAVIEELTLGMVHDFPDGESFALHPRLQALTLEVILRVVFGVDDADELDALRRHLEVFLELAGSLFVLNPAFRRRVGGVTPWARFARVRARLLQSLQDEIERRRTSADLASRRDMLSLLLQSQADGDELSDNELLHNLLTMVLAGHETTATALAWTFDLLLHDNSAHERLRRDLRAGDPAFLEAVVKESLRLRPVVLDTGRTLTAGVRIAGVDYPAGTTLTPSILLAHHDSTTYPDPMRFRPERFLENAAEPMTWIPFGGGARRCLGAGFASLEMRVIIRTTLQNCELAAARAKPDGQKRRAITLVPRHGTRVVIRSVCESGQRGS
jgi:cytochrome P450